MSCPGSPQRRSAAPFGSAIVDAGAPSWSVRSRLRHQLIAWIEVLMRHEDLMDVERVRRVAGEVIAEHLKDMFQSRRIVDVDIRAALVAVLEERELKVAEGIQRLVAARGKKSRRRLVERSVHRAEVVAVDE